MIAHLFFQEAFAAFLGGMARFRKALLEVLAVFDRVTRFFVQRLGSGYEFPGMPDYWERIFKRHGCLLVRVLLTFWS